MEQPITIKVLMIHGYGQSGPHLDKKSSRLQRAVREALTNRTGICDVAFCFPTAQCRIPIPDLPDPDKSEGGEELGNLDMWTWCMDYSSGGNKFFDETKKISDLSNALDSIAEIIRQHGPFDGVIGFSSGACIAALIASLLEEGRKEAFENWMAENAAIEICSMLLRVQPRPPHVLSILPTADPNTDTTRSGQMGHSC
ncbi:hypothetical protein O988_05598 [Pseudogymnoascus sp. VKM F-3808]|nr:hypothetical protein O988_05598 [Pseudogymnoascus sp. VKM F-3808]